MSDYIGVVTNIGQAKIAAAIGGTALNLATIRVGDGNGAPIVPNPAMTDLVRRVGAAYPIVSSGRDPVNANHWRVTALIPVNDGPFDIREIGVWDAAGDMIAVAKHVLVEKRTPAQGAAVELLTDIVFPVSETAQVTVQVTPVAQISIFQLLRAGFTVVESATVTAPPGAPALGRTHVVPAGATGSWNGFAGYLVQWNGIVWVAVDVPEGFVVVDKSKARWAGNRWLERTAAGWEAGVTRLVQRQPGNFAAAAGTPDDLEIELDPAPASIADLLGVPIRVKTGAAANGGAVRLKVNTLPLVSVRGADGLELLQGELPANTLFEVAHNGAIFQIINRAVPSAQRAPSAFIMNTNAVQAVAQSTATVIGNLATTLNNTVDSVLSATQITIGPKDAGWWAIIGKLLYDFPTSGTMYTNVIIERNGVEISAGNAPGTTTVRARPTATGIYKLAAGDVIRLSTATDTARNLVVTGGSSIFAGFKIGA